ncbi:methyltransferase domain-containing protein [Colletotrichum lupini]|uniref:Methyltransferase domain-containing protein n=1 Tax=Colletotrichum lupini TaxID=145971 RepID=A0A9Q8SBA6_9PEZI|nr:methyltransferase domain-containing protein [Colletotrichum lupini]UQC73908.1 methyltransferase domain-containing protein [Colletotrichum lupini]
MDRLDFCHALLTRTVGNKLFLAPVDETKMHRVLDVGTGTGAIEIGNKYPNAEVYMLFNTTQASMPIISTLL